MLQGSLVALITPMRTNGNVDYAALHRLIDWHLEAGTHGIVPVGTTGESATLTVPEHHQVISETIKRVDGRVPVVAGTGANATDEAIELTKFGEGAGADAVLLVTPYYNKPPQEGLYRHYSAICEATDVPKVLYNVPPRTACDMSAQTVARLAPIPSIVGIKEACGDPNRVKEIRDLVPDESFVILSGEDAQTLTMCGFGAVGTISVTANVLPELMSQFCEAVLEGDSSKASEIDQRLQPVHEYLFCETSPIPTKWALSDLGRIDDGIRLPLVPLSEDKRAELRRRIATASA